LILAEITHAFDHDKDDSTQHVSASKITISTFLRAMEISEQSFCIILIFTVKINFFRTMFPKEYYLLGYNAVYSTESEPTSRRKTSPPSSGQKNKPNKKLA
jgi:hypothetical protein